MAFRGSKVRLEDKKHRSKAEVDLTLALNYYFNKHFALMSSYTLAEVQKPSVLRENIIQVRGVYGF